jgi:hypothetical protein
MVDGVAVVSAVKPITPAWHDRVGVWASLLCLVHCLLTPVLLSGSAVLAHFLPGDEPVHRTLAPLIAIVGAIALLRGFRIHGRRRVVTLMVVGLAFIFFAAFGNKHLPDHRAEIVVTMVGSAFLIAAHRLNHTFCADCACAHDHDEPVGA